MLHGSREFGTAPRRECLDLHAPSSPEIPQARTFRPSSTGRRSEIGRHEDHGAFRDLARSLAVSLSDRTIEADGVFDVIGGVAGYVLLLLRIEEEEPIPRTADVVGRMADHLVRHARDVEKPGWASRSDEQPLCGFGHGRAGIALALVESGRFLDRPDLVDLGLAAFEAEHRERGATPKDTWPDFRGLGIREKHRANPGMAAWCAGSEGIALSRAAALQVVEAPHLEEDLSFALESIASFNPSGRTSLCCGASGRLMAHQTLRRYRDLPTPGDESTWRSRVGCLLDRASTADPGTRGVGLMQGATGVAWLGLSAVKDDGSDLMLLRP